MFDVLIIGAGVTGCAIARELSRYETSVVVLEKALDVCEGTSKANSGIVHAGFDAVPGSLKAKLNVIGNEEMEQLSKTLDFPFERNGSLVVCFSEEERKELIRLKEQGEKNHVPGLKILSKEEALLLEPNLSKNAAAALYAPTGGIVCPFGLTIALAENAFCNGVKFEFDQNVTEIEKLEDHFVVSTTNKTYEARNVVDAAGVYADVLCHMVSEERINITARKGEYCLVDKTVRNFVKHTIFQLPTKLGKGVLVTRTVHGNLLLGPTAADIFDKEATNTTGDGIAKVLTNAAKSVTDLPKNKFITSFAGLRAHEDCDDFILKEASDCKGFFIAGGMESPGLTCAPAVGTYMADIVMKSVQAPKKKDFIEKRTGIVSMAAASLKKQQEMIKKDARYANVICRCEMVTEGEIVDAIHRPLGATTLDGVKRRTRAGMGRCQSGFCSPKVLNILAKELHKPVEEIYKSGKGSFLLSDRKETL